MLFLFSHSKNVAIIDLIFWIIDGNSSCQLYLSKGDKSLQNQPLQYTFAYLPFLVIKISKNKNTACQNDKFHRNILNSLPLQSSAFYVRSYWNSIEFSGLLFHISLIQFWDVVALTRQRLQTFLTSCVHFQVLYQKFWQKEDKIRNFTICRMNM